MFGTYAAVDQFTVNAIEKLWIKMSRQRTFNKGLLVGGSPLSFPSMLIAQTLFSHFAGPDVARHKYQAVSEIDRLITV